MNVTSVKLVSGFGSSDSRTVEATLLVNASGAWQSAQLREYVEQACREKQERDQREAEASQLVLGQCPECFEINRHADSCGRRRR